MKFLYLSIFCFLTFMGYSQEYKLTTFQTAYKEIEGYKSIQIEKRGDILDNKIFDLGFTFPYFENLYSSIELSNKGILSFEDEIDFSMRLLTFGYYWDSVTDINDIPSDIRYKDTVVDGKKCLIIQFTKMRLNSDPSIKEFDSFINFQYWLFENGIIDLVIGPYSLDKSPNYVSGEGFYLLTGDGPKLVGPEIALYHPTDINRRYSYDDSDSYLNYRFEDNDIGSMKWLPPSGWTFRFTNQLVSTYDLTDELTYKLYPNPVTNILKLDAHKTINTISIYNNHGELLLKAYDQKEIDLYQLMPGLYTVLLTTNTKSVKYKIVKI